MAFEFSDDTKRAIYLRQQGVCAHCGNRVINQYHHVVPRQSGDPNNMTHGWLASEINGVGLCDFDHKGVHIGDDAELKIRYKDAPVPPAGFFEFAHGKGDKADPAKQRAWVAQHRRLAKPVWDDLQRRFKSSQAGSLLASNMQPPGGERPNINLALKRARLRRSSGGFVDISFRGGEGTFTKRQVGGAAMLIGMVIGAATKYALACQNEDEQSRDLNQWEQWIHRQQLHAPSMGYLLAVQYSILEMGPAEPMVKYVLTAGYMASSIEKAGELMRQDPPDNALARSGEFDPAQLIYPDPMLHWYPPLAPVGGNHANETLRAVLAAMEPPSDDREAFHILDGATMPDLLLIYQEILKESGYSPLWRSIDRANISNKHRLTAAVKAVRDKQAGLSFGNYRATMTSPLPPPESDDFKALQGHFGVNKQASVLPAWLQGWWTVYDGNYYYYYFAESPSVAFIKSKPSSGSAPPLQWPNNRGTVAMTDNGCKITWNPNGPGGPTIEKFSQLHAKGNEMNGESNKYSPLFARKMPDA